MTRRPRKATARSSASAEGPRDATKSVEMLSTAAQLYEKSHFKRLQLVHDLERCPRSSVIATIRLVIYDFLLVLCSNNGSIHTELSVRADSSDWRWLK